MKKAFALVLTFVLTFSVLLTACSNNASQTDVKPKKEKEVEVTTDNGREMVGNMYKTDFPIVKDQITLQAVISKNPMHGNFSEMIPLKKLEEKTNIHIEWEEIPNANYTEKKNLMFASNDLPDIFFGGGINRDDEMKYGTQGYLIPLEELIKEWAPNINNMFNKKPNTRKMCTTPDGHIYSLVQLNDLLCRNNPDNMFINKTWLNKLGLELPTTTEEYFNVLKAFKEKDPNGNNKADEIPLSFRHGNQIQGEYSLLGAFGVLDNSNHLMVNNGKVIYVPIQEEYKKAIKFLNRLYSEGLIDPEVFTQDGKEYFAKGKTKDMVLGSFFIWFDENVVGADRAINDYECLPPLKGPNGEQMWNRYDNSCLTGMFSITNSNKYVKETVRWVNEFYTEDMSFECTWGPYDVVIKKNEDGTVSTLDAPEGMSRDEFRYKNCPGPAVPTAFYSEYFDKYETSNDVKRKMERYILYEPYMPKEIYPPVYFTQQQQEELSILNTDINSYVDKMFASWVVGDSNIDDDWSKYVNKIKDMGYENMFKIYQDALDIFNKN